MDQAQFKAAWGAARGRHWMSHSIDGLYFSAGQRLIARAEVEPRRTYWAVATQQHGTVEDRMFYVRRARAIRRSGFKNNWPDVPNLRR